MARSSATTYYANDPATGLMSEKRVSGSGSQWHDYILADGRIVAERVTQGESVTLRYIVSDHLGSTAVVTNASGAVIERNAYDPWGKRRNLNGSDDTACALASGTTRGFTGHEHLDENCLINMNARIYDPATGRFLSADDIVPDGSDSQSFNRYAYVNNGPLSATDPTGHEDTDMEGCQELCQRLLNQKFAEMFGLTEQMKVVYSHIVPCGQTFRSGSTLYIGACDDPTQIPDGRTSEVTFPNVPPVIIRLDNFGGGGGGGGGAGGQNKGKQVMCAGKAYVMSGNPAYLKSEHHGAWGALITPNSAAIIPRQWTGKNYRDASYKSFGQNTYGFMYSADRKTTSWFSGLTDVVDGTKINGLTIHNSVLFQDQIMARSPGELVIETPGGPDLGKHANVLLVTDNPKGCPIGTTQVGD